MITSNPLLRFNYNHQSALLKQTFTCLGVFVPQFKSFSTLQHCLTVGSNVACNIAVKQIAVYSKCFNSCKNFHSSKKLLSKNSPDLEEKKKEIAAYIIGAALVLLTCVAYLFMETHQDYVTKDYVPQSKK